jgi:alpha-L-fucosidase 2
MLCPALHAESIRDAEYARRGGIALTYDAYIPEKSRPQPAVILVHGGGWEAGDKRTYIQPWFPVFSKAGLAWFSIDYRLAPKDRFPAAVEDVEDAVRYLQKHAARFNIDPERIALVGESAGGHLVSLVAARGKVRVRAAVSFYGIHDIELWRRQRGEMPKNIAQFLGTADPKQASPITFVTKNTPPMLFIHGTEDRGVPLAQSAAMCAAMKAAGARCEVYAVEGAPHGVEGWEKNPAFTGYKTRMIAWLREALGIG